ncbi:MAG TPA: hypothetical protein VKA80_11990, partial [Beijerinckiaceae bacterium]|nr:hypothetical protein [Beijerinckiaceae bacterium]
MITRRALLTSAALGLGTGAAGSFADVALAAPRPPLIDGVRAACRRLARHGWRELLLAATGGELDMGAEDLRRELSKELGSVDRKLPGLADFASAGRRGIELGNPAASLLYHAFASPDVIESRSGKPLTAFPTLAEIEAVENYVYGAKPPNIAELRARAGGSPLAIAVFALDYRRAADTVHGRQADLAFARTGIARIGTVGLHYDPRERAFMALDPANPFAFRTMPQRFAACIAMRAPGDRERFGPRDALSDDDKRQFWVPLHKLFDGRECLAGLDLTVGLTRHLRNEKLRRFHRFLEIQGHASNWTGPDLERFPFVIRDERIASFSRRPELGSGVLEPVAAPFAMRARYRDRWLTFEVPPGFVQEPGVMYFSTAQILPGEVETEPSYMEGLAPTTDRSAPEYISIRHRVRPDGGIDNLNDDPNMMEVLKAGGYKAQHFIDFAGDGWIEARCPQLAGEVPTRLPAYCLVSPPDFFPSVSQRDLTQWWRREVPEALHAALWAIPPIPLSDKRMAANITLPTSFSINDTTVTAVVSHPHAPPAAGAPAARSSGRYSGLPDASPGIFDPGWDTSQGIHYSDPDVPVQAFMQNYGLGTPFVEDIKLCAALGSYWPAVAPDSARTFSPHKRGPGFAYPWPTIVPLTDEETGIAPLEGGRYLPWDGVRGPRLETIGGRDVAVYPDIERVDYLGNLDKITAALTAKIDLAETKARVLAMATVYWSLGVRDPEFRARRRSDQDRQWVVETLKAKAGWAVLSFRNATEGDAELKGAEDAAGARLAGERRYRFHVYRPGPESRHPSDLKSVLVELKEQA